MKSSFSILVCLSVVLGTVLPARSMEVNYITGTMFETRKVPGGSLTINGNLQSLGPIDDNVSFGEDFVNGGTFTLTESDMMDPLGGTTDDLNRHEFNFAHIDPNMVVTPIELKKTVPWEIAVDVNITTAAWQPRKSIAISIRDSNVGLPGGASSNINLTTSGPPANALNGGANNTRGESAVFGGTAQLNRVIGPCDNGTGSQVCGAFDLNQVETDPNVFVGEHEYIAGETGVSAGETVRMEIKHVPSPDGGTTPAQLLYTYTNLTTLVTESNLDIDLKNPASGHPSNTGEFTDDYQLGFNILGRAEQSFGTDDYTITLSNFLVTIGDADFDDDQDVDGIDFLAWQRGFGVGTTHAQGDANFDGVVDSADLGAWESQYGAPPNLTAIVSVPEPTTAIQLMVFVPLVLSVLNRRREQDENRN